MRVESGIDKWVEIKITNTDDQLVNFDFEVLDLDNKKEEIIY